MEDMDYNEFEEILQKINNNVYYVILSVIESIKDSEEFRELSYSSEYRQYANKLLLECIRDAYFEGAHYTLRLLTEELDAIVERRKKEC
ncbi:hypothetical protein [Candidatus Stoquefichus massiliensis]|uniref:hypothetical protein n=1 Tax=Candidatus Stoquefichus massiliensis TaxID=1470350 RepID=UPI000486091E|nr:hypothetical protein [Candidatus Stoquefichus massiliensis]